MIRKRINDVEVNEESIITALKIIQSVCVDNEDDCKSCPFNTSEDDNRICGITDLEPNNWNILGYKKFQALG